MQNETPAKRMSFHGNSQRDPYLPEEQEKSAKEEKSTYERVRKVVTPLWNIPISVQLEKKEVPCSIRNPTVVFLVSGSNPITKSHLFRYPLVTGEAKICLFSTYN